MIDNFDTGIQINVSEETLYENASRKALTFKDLHIGNQVQVYHSPMMTFSIPPQSPRIKVIVV